MLSIGQLAQRYAYPDVGDRAWVRSNFVSSIDGAVHDESGRSGGLGTADDHTIFHVLRSLADVIVVGAATARTEGYAPVLPTEIHPELRDDQQRALPPIAVASRSLDVPARLQSAGQILVTTGNSDASERARLAERMDVVVAGTDTIDWADALAQLADRGLGRVLCEGGPRVHGDLVAADLVDEVCLTVSGAMLSGPAGRIATGPAVHRAMVLADHLVGDTMIATRWLRDRTR